MSKPLVVSIPHNLGKAEATRRLQGGLGGVKSQFGERIASIEESWNNDRMEFRVGTMGQSIDGHQRTLSANKAPYCSKRNESQQTFRG
jgi:hypothetical protein